MSKEITPSERRQIAAQVNVNEAYLYQCLTGRRDMNPAEAVRIEQETQSRISRFDLCKKTGHGIWPELAQSNAITTPAATENVAVQGAA